MKKLLLLLPLIIFGCDSGTSTNDTPCIAWTGIAYYTFNGDTVGTIDSNVVVSICGKSGSISKGNYTLEDILYIRLPKKAGGTYYAKLEDHKAGTPDVFIAKEEPDGRFLVADCVVNAGGDIYHFRGSRP